MSDDETRPLEPGAPASTHASEEDNHPKPPAQAAQPAYAMPLPAGYPTYAAQQRPRFADQVLGMRAVVAVALACLIIGGLSGWILGHAAGSDGDLFGPGPGFMQRGKFPDGSNGLPNGPNGFSDQQPNQPPTPFGGR